ncbi:MAG: hypothetical protein AAGJ93_15120, partial [Bacteroidota bacterium]
MKRLLPLSLLLGLLLHFQSYTYAQDFAPAGDICANADILTGLGGATPVGGVYSGPGVTDDGNSMTYSFNPAEADIGTNTISYTLPGGFNQLGADIDGEAADDDSGFSVS